MKFSDRQEEETHINLTPLIDVVFLLLIFFMVSTTFSKESQLRIRLPESSDQKQTEQETQFLEIEISADGVFAIKGPNDEKARELINTTRDTLRRALAEAAGGDTELVTLIRADRRTPHESVIQAMDMARRLGYTDITFATQQVAEKSSAP
ncbi:MAG: biopolymer transporter ExbD [Gammaproteobacteria bacterium]|nr:biopolymer transporter ExbD [Gammaproteobacteria bacterium]